MKSAIYVAYRCFVWERCTKYFKYLISFTSALLSETILIGWILNKIFLKFSFDNQVKWWISSTWKEHFEMLWKKFAEICK